MRGKKYETRSSAPSGDTESPGAIDAECRGMTHVARRLEHPNIRIPSFGRLSDRILRYVPIDRSAQVLEIDFQFPDDRLLREFSAYTRNSLSPSLDTRVSRRPSPRSTWRDVVTRRSYWPSTISEGADTITTANAEPAKRAHGSREKEEETNGRQLDTRDVGVPAFAIQAFCENSYRH